MSAAESRRAVAPPPQRGRAPPARERCAGSCARRPSSVGAFVVGFWSFCAIFGTSSRPHDPIFDNQFVAEPAADEGAPVRHRLDRPRRVLARDRRARGHPAIRPRRRSSPPCSARRSASSPATSAASSTTSSAASSSRSSRFPLIIMRSSWSPRSALGRRSDRSSSASSSRRSSRAPCAPRCSAEARAGLRAGGPAARRAGALHPVRRDPAEHRAADHRRVHGAARLRDLRGRDARRSSASASQPPSPDWAAQISEYYTLIDPLLVDGALPGARDRLAGRGGQPGRRRPQQVLRAMSADARADAARSSVARPRRRLPRARRRARGAARRLASRSSAGGPTGSSASRAAASRRPRSAIVRYLPRNGRVSGGLDHRRGADVLALGRRELRALPRATRLDGLPEPRHGAEPVDPRRQAGRRGVHGARRVEERGARARARGARPGADRRPGERAWSATRTSSRAACSSAS